MSKALINGIAISQKRARIWKIAAWVAWTVVMVVLTVRSGSGRRHSCAYADYQGAGLHWLQGEALYNGTRGYGYVYSPLVAVIFTPVAYIKPSIGVVLWQLVNAAAFMGGLLALIHTTFPVSFRKYSSIAALLMIPFALGNLDVGQANPLLAGLIMATIAAAHTERWGTAAVLAALATEMKIYPLSIGLLLLVVAPRRFFRPLLAALVLSVVAPFLFQRWPYVFAQYHTWIVTRGTDDRLSRPFFGSELDAWFILRWICHVDVPHLLYRLFQIGCGGAFALLCAAGKRKGWSFDRLLLCVLCLGSVWMTLLGPSTESYTYLLLSPVVVLVFVRSFVDGHGVWLRASFAAAFGLQLFAVARSSLMPHFSPPWALAAQPFSALLFLVGSLGWLLSNRYWPADTIPREVRRLRI